MNNKRLDEIWELSSKNKNKVIPFIGAGFSKNIDYPDWKDFIKDELNPKLYEICNIKINLDIVFPDPTEAAEFYIWKVGKKIDPRDIFNSGKLNFRDRLVSYFNDFDKACLSAFKKDPGLLKQHISLVQNFTTLYTTNWDIALELTCQEKIGGYTQVYSCNGDIKKIRGGTKNINKRVIIKFHGTYGDMSAKSIIGCRTDYYNRIFSECPLDFKFKSDLLYNDFLFIGYSFSDSNINYMLDEMRLLTQGAFRTLMKRNPKIFWITTERLNTRQKELYKKWYNIYPVWILKKSQQNQLKQSEKSLKTKCDNCRYNIYKCNTIERHEIECYNCVDKRNVEDQKQKVFKKQIEYLLDQI